MDVHVSAAAIAEDGSVAEHRKDCGILMRTRRGAAIRSRPCVRLFGHGGKHRYRSVDVLVTREAPGFFVFSLRTRAAC